MSEATIPAQGPVDVLVRRLRAHAEAHEYIANATRRHTMSMTPLTKLENEMLQIIMTKGFIAWIDTYSKDVKTLRRLDKKGYVREVVDRSGLPAWVLR